MGTQKVMVEILDTSRERISTELHQQMSGSLNEWETQALKSKNPWDKIVVAIMAEIFKIDLC